MLTFSGLVQLERSLRGAHVLSVFIDGTAPDPATRRSWRLVLDRSLRDLRTWLADSAHAEREGFNRCVTLLEAQLERYHGAIGAPGWAGFLSADGVRYAEALPVPMPTLAVWSTGAYVAPYIRALKQHRPVFVALVDARMATVFRYLGGTLKKVETIRAHARIDQTLHMGSPGREGFHTGVRGATGRDAAQRQLMEGTDRMLRELGERLVHLAGADGWVLVGGIPVTSQLAAQMLPRALRNRTLQLDSLDIHASDAEIADAARAGASALRDATDHLRLDTLVELAGERGAAMLGASDTRAALAQSGVRELYLTRRFRDEHALEAEELVRSAFDQGALVEEVSGPAAEQLDRYGGIAAQLRYPMGRAERVALGLEPEAAGEGEAPPQSPSQ